MASTRISVAALFATISGIAALACGGSGDDASLFKPTVADSGTPAPIDDAGNILQQPGDDGGGSLGDSGAACTPAQVPASFSPTWIQPAHDKSGACTQQQITEFFASCLTPPIDTQKCSDFKAANTTCGSCIESDDTDSKYGPVIWHSNRTYYTLNVAGCIADQQGDMGTHSCGAEYQAVLQCKEAACTQCFGTSGNNFSQFSACESSAGTECEAYASAMHTACGDGIHDANDPASVCIPPSGTSTKDAYGRIAPIFCAN